MSTFEYFSVALTFVVGLGLARLLLGGLYVFRSRNRHAVDWIPLTWAAIIFLLKVQFWWAVFQLNDLIDVWTRQVFLTFLALTLLLFVAGALILPSSDEHTSDDKADYFEENGRWALLAISAYAVGSVGANWLLFDVSPFSLAGLAIAAFAVLAIAAFLAQDRRLRGGLTAAFIVIAVWAWVAMAPGAYE